MSLAKCFLRAQILVFGLTASSLSQAATSAELEELYLKLRQAPVSYEVFGTVCEQIARIRMEEKFPADQFELVTGIIYEGRSDEGGFRTLGELDVVVLRRADGEAISINEVKCWKNLDKARGKARQQLERFAHYMSVAKTLTMYLADNVKRHFKMDQFDEQPEYLAASQDGGEEFGFNWTIGVSLDEAHVLRNKLLSWHARHPVGRQNR